MSCDGDALAVNGFFAFGCSIKLSAQSQLSAIFVMDPVRAASGSSVESGLLETRILAAQSMRFADETVTFAASQDNGSIVCRMMKRPRRRWNTLRSGSPGPESRPNARTPWKNETVSSFKRPPGNHAGGDSM
ncbi:hypothetical protein N7539_002866 [Penicillium diatomitis]|uniref:Uncharacterized protein n=1 Tax=Penicillium diatomitis TaxID=2819901 RepID=A0A9W9XFL0_9EURO|nr:uncharacterized protein N7539_002866 [Penicillium diatomitis]KAJ5491299.1 hypothetical protein N7539_002866 [Penicillium diatomitis]